MSERPISTNAAGLVRAFAEDGFVLSRPAAGALTLADTLQKPLLIEGPPGVGKTVTAELWAKTHGAPLLRLQCYEGIDESRAIYEWSYGKQVLYSQLLRDMVGEVTAGAKTLDDAISRLHGQTDAFFSKEFLLPRPLLEAVLSEKPVVLLIDEIDRSDEEFEAFLLELLGEFQITIPELGTLTARHRPRVVLTSNDTRDLADALRRRCLYLYLDYPTTEEEAAILERRVPDLDATLRSRLAAFVARVRKSQLRKAPGIAETIDWGMALVAVGAEDLTREEITETIGALIKNRDDLKAVLESLKSFRAP